MLNNPKHGPLATDLTRVWLVVTAETLKPEAAETLFHWPGVPFFEVVCLDVPGCFGFGVHVAYGGRFGYTLPEFN